jgi:breast cancer 2 susceptibility protein
MIHLTDGWYGIAATLDPPLSRLLHQRKLFVGQKLHIQTCALTGSGEARPVLEIGSETKLQLNANCTRRARWSEFLGYQKSVLFPIAISSILEDGGLVTLLDVIVLRILPVIFVETLPDGKRVFRSETEEEDARSQWEKLHFSLVEKAQMELMKSNSDARSESLQEELHLYIEEHLPQRRVKVCYTLQVMDYPPMEEWKNRCEKAYVTIWDQSGLSQLNEGTRLRISHLVPVKNGIDGLLNLKSTNRTKLSEQRVSMTHLFVPRHLIPCEKLRRRKGHDLVDILVLILGSFV